MPPNNGLATCHPVPIRTVAYGRGEDRDGERSLAVEMPVNVIYGDVPYAVMMTTPADLADFAYGFSLTEGIVANAAEIRGARVETGEGAFASSSTSSRAACASTSPASGRSRAAPAAASVASTT